MAPFSTSSFDDCLMDVYCVPGTGLGFREQKEQSLGSNDTYHAEAVRQGGDTENKQVNKIISDIRKYQIMCGKSGYFSLGNLGSFLPKCVD